MAKKAKKENSVSWVDVHDDFEMILLGIRHKVYARPNFSKSAKEKEVLKKVRSNNTKFYSGKIEHSKKIPCYGKLIVYTNRDRGSNRNHNTYSFKCYQYEIETIFKNLFSDGSIIKYWWNGYTYNSKINAKDGLYYPVAI